MNNFSGKSEIEHFTKDDTLYIFFNTSIAGGIIKITNKAKIDVNNRKPVNIISEYKKFGIKSKGKMEFGKDFIISSLSNEKEKIFSNLKYQPNDWLILPFYLQLLDTDIYRCSMIHGDFELLKKEANDTIFWEDVSKNLYVKIYKNKFIFLRADKVIMEMVNE